MKTHEFARALEQLAKILRSAPDVELSRLESTIPKAREKLSSDEMALSLTYLVALSQIDKEQWIAFIKEHGIPIEVRNRDASRDILGKMLRHLESNKEAQRQLQNQIAQRADQSSALARAFQILLRENNDHSI